MGRTALSAATDERESQRGEKARWNQTGSYAVFNGTPSLRDAVFIPFQIATQLGLLAKEGVIQGVIYLLGQQLPETEDFYSYLLMLI